MAAEDERTDAASPGATDAPAPPAGVLDDLATAVTAAGTLLGALARLARAELRLAWRGVRLAVWALLTTVLLLLFLLLTLVILLIWLLLHVTGSLGAGLALTALVLLLALFGARALLRLGLRWLSLPGTRAEVRAALQSLIGKRDPP
ncbi:MAG TPA: ABC transporter ATP-binding protein [Rhodanobacteraceae bacterium]|nr:ABC transporter ATP-binding protein [Rhodanobacteraceae bacterium]